MYTTDNIKAYQQIFSTELKKYLNVGITIASTAYPSSEGVVFVFALGVSQNETSKIMAESNTLQQAVDRTGMFKGEIPTELHDKKFFIIVLSSIVVVMPSKCVFDEKEVVSDVKKCVQRIQNMKKNENRI